MYMCVYQLSVTAHVHDCVIIIYTYWVRVVYKCWVSEKEFIH